MNPTIEKSPAPVGPTSSGGGACGSLEEADTHIQTGSCHANPHDDAKTANHSDHVHSVADLRFGNGRHGDFRNCFHVTPSTDDPLRRGPPVQTNFKEFMK